ncbi:DUF4439 domain-containing protein [Kitasatospora sp. NPDC054939]
MQPHSRRTFLALGLLATASAAVACTGSDDDGRTGERRRPDPDEPIRRRAVTAADALLAGYDALPAGQAERLRALRAEVEQHRAAFGGGPAGASEAPSGSAAPSGTARPAGSAPPPASGSATAPAGAGVTTAAALATLERQTAQAYLAELGAASPQLARLLASAAAADVLHAVALGDAAPLHPTTPTTPTPAAPTTPAAAAAPTASGPASAAPSGSGSAAPSALGAEAVTALQSALSAEHAAVYGYGVVGARLPDDDQRADARTAHAAHQSRRDSWQRLLHGVGSTPSAASAGYRLPFPVTDAAGAGRLAAHIETRLTAVYADLVGALPGPRRAAASDALREAALRAQRWGAAPGPFPGLPDPAATPAPTTTP